MVPSCIPVMLVQSCDKAVRVLQCVAIDPTEERIAAGDESGRILIWNDFARKVPKLQKASPAATAAAPASTAAADTAMKAPEQKRDTDSDSGSDSDDSEEAQPASSSANAQQPQAQDSSRQKQPSTAGTAGTAGNVDAYGQHEKVTQEKFSKLRQSMASVPVMTVHWHAHPVGAVCFSADGTLLLSGGEEAVLVSFRPP